MSAGVRIRLGSRSAGSDGVQGEYKAVLGSVITEEFNETLNSATAIIAHVPESQRIFDICPYMEAQVVVRLTDRPYDGAESVSFFLVDTYEETLESVNSGGVRYYSYTIQLMSRTKYLEKIQCPNLCVTHSERTRTIRDVIVNWYDQYCPRIRVYAGDVGGVPTWRWSRLLEIDGTDAFASKFDVPCADLQLSHPTLRQALSALMAQVGCIPVVKGRYITYMDLRAEQPRSPLQDMEDVTIARSCSSDSFVNRLVNSSGNLLDDSGYSVSELLKFSDRDNLLLKQLDNLKLETRFPIFRVDSLVAHAFFGGTSIDVYPIRNCPGEINGSPVHSSFMALGPLGKFILPFYFDSNVDYFTIGFDHPSVDRARVSGTIYYLRKRVNGYSYGWELMRQSAIDHEDTCWRAGDGTFWRIMNGVNISTDYAKKPYAGGEDDQMVVFVGHAWLHASGSAEEWDVANAPIVISDKMKYTASDFVGAAAFDIYGRYFVQRDSDGTVSEDGIMDWLRGHTVLFPCQRVEFTEVYVSDYLYKFEDKDVNDASTLDMTPLCFDEVKRQGLDMNFVSLTKKPKPVAVSDLAKYYYSTVGYNVGGTEIFGFSQHYEETNGWWDTTKSVAQILCEAADGWVSRYQNLTISQVSDMFGGIFDSYLSELGYNTYAYREGEFSSDVTGYSVNYSADRTPVTPWGESGYSYATMFFDVIYRPIASPVLKFSGKVDDMAIPLEQMDSKQSGLSSVESVSSAEYDTVERLTSDMLSIHQRIPLHRGYDDDEKSFSECLGKIGGLNEYLEYNGRKYTVFKRAMSVKAHAIEVDYYASRDYVVKNFYTAVITKYRAYQYVDLSQSTERHEHVLQFLTVSESGAPSQSDQVLLNGNAGGASVRRLVNGMDTLAGVSSSASWSGTSVWSSYLLGGRNPKKTKANAQDMADRRWSIDSDDCLPEPDGLSVSARKWRKATSDDDYWYQDEMAMTHSDNFIAFTALDFDNASEGLHISDRYVRGTGVRSNQKLGGIPQQWYPAPSYNGEEEGYEVASLYGFEFASRMKHYTDYASFDEVMDLPRLIGNPHSDCGSALYISVNDAGDDSSPMIGFLKKDNAERLAVTVQFELDGRVPPDVFWMNESFFSKSSYGMTSRKGYYEVIEGKTCVCVGVWAVSGYPGSGKSSWRDYSYATLRMSGHYEYEYDSSAQYQNKGTFAISRTIETQSGYLSQPDRLGGDGDAVSFGSDGSGPLHIGNSDKSSGRSIIAAYVPVADYKAALEDIEESDGSDDERSHEIRCYAKQMGFVGAGKTVYFGLSGQKGDAVFDRMWKVGTEMPGGGSYDGLDVLCPMYSVAYSTDPLDEKEAVRVENQ